MKKHTLILISTLLGGALLPAAVMGHHYQKTPGYQNIVNWAGSLNGIAFTDPRFTPYCNSYAQFAVRQAQQRLSQNCASVIKTPTANLQKRWSTNYWGHKGWCQSVSSHASRAELVTRENRLRSCMMNHAPTPAQIRQNCVANDNIHKKAARGDVNFVRKCLDAGVNVNIREGNRWTPLHSAARNGRINIAQLLMARGASVNARDVNGRTPLDQAIAGHYVAMENYLRSRGGVTR